MNIGPYSFDEFIEKIKVFHGSIAPGIVAGGFMVDIARANLPQGEFFDVICESQHCLPDAVQILTQCTIGNRWLKIVDTSRYALTFYNKYTGDGIRVYLDAKKLQEWPAIRAWFLKETPKKEQEQQQILNEFREAGTSIYSTAKATVKPSYITSLGKKRSSIGKRLTNPSFLPVSFGLCFPAMKNLHHWEARDDHRRSAYPLADHHRPPSDQRHEHRRLLSGKPYPFIPFLYLAPQAQKAAATLRRRLP